MSYLRVRKSDGLITLISQQPIEEVAEYEVVTVPIHPKFGDNQHLYYKNGEIIAINLEPAIIDVVPE